MSDYLTPGSVYVGDVREWAAKLRPNSIHCLVTSPPYFGLRSYLDAAHDDKHQELGSEATPQAYVANLVSVFEALKSAIHSSGTVWVNCGDSYNAARNGGHPGGGKQWKPEQGKYPNRSGANVPGLGPKQLLMVPARFAIAMQDMGWLLRSDIIWHKLNPMPESVTDRPTSAHEHIFLFAKQAKYFFDQDAVRENVTGGTHGKGTSRQEPKALQHEDSRHGVKNNRSYMEAIGQYTATSRNTRNVLSLASEAFPGSHFATFPRAIPRFAIRAGSSARGCCPACGNPWRRVVERTAAVPASFNGSTFTNGKTGAVHASRGQGPRYETRDAGRWEPGCTCDAGDPIPCTIADCFSGSGTTPQVAVEEGRSWLACDLDARAVAWTAARLAKTQRRLPLEVG